MGRGLLKLYKLYKIISAAFLAVPILFSVSCKFSAEDITASTGDGRITFTGIKTATLSSDETTITITWDAASGNISPPLDYVIYNDAGMTNAVGVTTNLTYNYTVPSSAIGTTIFLGVHAQDEIGLDTNQHFVAVPVPDNKNHTPPIFAGLQQAVAAAPDKVELLWTASPSPTIYKYNIYMNTLTTPFTFVYANETNVLVSVSNSCSSGCTFFVHALDASGNEDTNTDGINVATLSYDVPNFAGLTSVARVQGTLGLSELTLSWSAAGPFNTITTVTQYNIYMSKTPGGENFSNAPLMSVSNVPGNITYNATVTGLSTATTYYFVVRAVGTNAQSVAYSDQNVLERSQSTLSIQAPTFAGISAASPAPGLSAFSQVQTAWPDPGLDGVYDGFNVYAEPGDCTQPFTTGLTPVNGAGSPISSTARSYNVSGLTANTQYRFKVNAVYSVAGIQDSNTTCLTATTTPNAPVFSGIGTLATTPGIPGFNSLDFTWTQATGSFTYYQIDLATDSAFTNIVSTQQLTSIGTTALTVTGLPTGTILYGRVAAVFSGSGVTLSSGGTKSISAKTQPVAPNDEGISSITVVDASTLYITWTAPTDPRALYSEYDLWRTCGASAATDIITVAQGAPTFTFGTSQLSYTDTGLTSNVLCYYHLRARYFDGTNTLLSASTTPDQGATPVQTPPIFSGIASPATNPNTANGFGSINISWTPVSNSDPNFSYYQVNWSTSVSNPTWTDPTSTAQISTRATSSYIVTGLTANTKYYFRVQAVNANGTPTVASGGNAVAQATTTPMAPTGDSITSLSVLGATSLQLVYNAPSSGLYNNVFLFVAAGGSAAAQSYLNSFNGVITQGNIAATVSGGRVAVPASLPAIIEIPTTEISTNQQSNTYQLTGLTTNQQVSILAEGVYWLNGVPAQFLQSTTPSTKGATPAAGPPQYAGIAGLTPFNDSRDFTEAAINIGTITGDCTGIDISVSTNAGTPDFTTYANEPCNSGSVFKVFGLTPYTTYYFQVRADNSVGSQTFYAGQGVQVSRIMRPTLPSGDQLTNVTATVVPKSLDSMTLTWTNATTGLWNNVYIFKAYNAQLATAQASVLAQAANLANNSGPTGTPYHIVPVSSPAANTPTTWTDTAVIAGYNTCYLAMAVWYDGTYYSSSGNTNVVCNQTPYTPISFGGVAATGSSIIGTWPDGSAEIQLAFTGIPGGTIEEFWVYYCTGSNSATCGNLSAAPWQKINYGDPTLDSNPNGTNILIGDQGVTLSGNGYYLVRAKNYKGRDSDTNTNVSNVISVPASKSNFVLVPTAQSGLSYPYYMMTYEASLKSGSYSASDAVTTNETNLGTCNTDFHVNGITLESACGSHASTAIVQSILGATPTTANFHQAWMACRNSSAPGFAMRLPTEEEWRRASRWPTGNYNTQWSTYQNSCNTSTSGVVANTGSNSSCVSAVGAYDMAGNVREWADARQVSYSISGNSENRIGSWGPTIGRLLNNGIDQAFRRYHVTTPDPTFGLGLLLGSDFSLTNYVYQKQYDAETEEWLPTNTSSSVTGFRCAGFIPAVNMPTMQQMALPQEPQYLTSDATPGYPATWTIPENLFVKDIRPETVSITTGAGGAVTISWRPWSKQVCNPNCSSANNNTFTYKIFRFQEPTLTDIRTSLPWALPGGPYTTAKPLDPLAVNSSLTNLYTPVATIAGSACNTSTPGGCTFVDSTSAGTGFLTTRLYDYIMEVQDDVGNLVIPKVQRFRSPYFAGDFVPSGTGQNASYRTEYRIRRAGVFLVDETYQMTTPTTPQVSVYVPMDQAGFDHDFFIHKYEASHPSSDVVGVLVNNSGQSSNVPLGGSSGSWQSAAGSCWDSLVRTGTWGSNCGTNGTTIYLSSSNAQTTPITGIDQGAMIRACGDTTFADSDGNSYRMHLPTNEEWTKAADYGDLNEGGTVLTGVDYSSIQGAGLTNISNLKSTACNISSSAVSLSADYSDFPERVYCVSRFGASEMYGSAAEWVQDRIYNDVGYDNGIDGLSTNASMATADAVATQFDFWRGLQLSIASMMAPVANNGDKYYTGTGALQGVSRGGGPAGGEVAGRWALYSNSAPVTTNSTLGGRCAY